MNPDAYLQMADVEARHWWYVARRTILGHIIKAMGLPAQARILELGCGTGGNLQMLSAHGKVSALELDATAHAIALRKAGGQCDVRAGNFPGDNPFADNKFDLICLFDVLEHLDQDVEALSAAKQLLSPGGRILLTVPAYQWLWSTHDVFLHHKRRYSAAELLVKVRASSLYPRRITHFNTLLFPLAVLVRLHERIFNLQQAAGADIPPSLINRLFQKIFASERYLLQLFSLPFGVSLLAVLGTEPEAA